MVFNLTLDNFTLANGFSQMFADPLRELLAIGIVERMTAAGRRLYEQQAPHRRILKFVAGVAAHASRK